MRKEVVRCDVCSETMTQTDTHFVVDGDQIDICSAACWTLWWERIWEKQMAHTCDVDVTFTKKKLEVVKHSV